MSKIFVLLLPLFPLIVSSQLFSSFINGYMVRSEEFYDCQPGSYFKKISRSSLIRMYRPDCHQVQVDGEGRNKYQAINWNGNPGLFDADVKRVFNVKEKSGNFQLDYSQTGPIFEKISFFAECDGGLIANQQEYQYNQTDCARPYLHLSSVKAFIHVGGKCHSVCWGNVTLK